MLSINQWLINLGKDESLWAKNLDSVPSMIHFEYSQLKGLAQEGQVYGVLLQCKDTYETILKIPVIMALVIIDNDPKYKDGSDYAEIMKAFLESPMSMGNWENLARIIVGKNNNLQLPDNLIGILKRTRKLYSAEITATVSNVVNWRNETIGHGALKFQDDVSYQEEVSNLLKLLKEYFDGDGKLSIRGLYDDCYFQCGENKLVSGYFESNIDNVGMILHVEAQAFSVANYINDCDLKWYLFESFYCRKNLVKYSSYIDGKKNTIQNKYFSDLFAKHVLQGSKNSAINRDYISREEDLILEYLHMPSDYVAPTRIVELLQEKMEETEKGIITITMERGTGKSAFANQMSGLYHSKPLMKNSFSRCYHVSNAALRGLSDFTTSINNGFRHSFNPAGDFWGSTDEPPSISLATEKPAESMAEFLNFYHEKYRKDYTVLIIDGIDEVTEQTERILDFIPSKKQLDYGVFVVLTTRFADEKTVKGKSKKYIEEAAELADSSLKVRRHDEINMELLNRYIENYKKTFKPEQNIDKDALIEKADYRILYLRAYLGISDRVNLDNANETKFVKSYMDYILSFYGISQKQTLKEIAVTISLFPGISIKQYQEYLNCQEITYEFVGLFNDLRPLLTVTYLDGEDVYEFADAAYADFVIEAYPDVVKDVIKVFDESMNSHLGSYIQIGRTVLKNSNNELNGKKLNRDIVFFIDGLNGLYNKSIEYQNIADSFFNNTVIFDFALQILCDYWANVGVLYLCRQKLLQCISEGLYYGLQGKCGKKCLTWTNEVNQQLLRIDDNRIYRVAKKLNHSSIVNYLQKNYRDISNIQYWFWALIKFPNPSSTSLINDLKCVDEFAEFAIKWSLNDGDVQNVVLNWLLNLGRANITNPSIEEKVLNYLYKYYKLNNRHIGINKCKEFMDKRGYKLLPRIQFINTATPFLKNIEAIQKACEILLDFNISLINDSQQIAIFYDVYNVLFERIQKEPNNVQLAFYKRMCYERDQGTLGGFLDNIIRFFVEKKRHIFNDIHDICYYMYTIVVDYNYWLSEEVFEVETDNEDEDIFFYKDLEFNNLLQNNFEETINNCRDNLFGLEDQTNCIIEEFETTDKETRIINKINNDSIFAIEGKTKIQRYKEIFEKELPRWIAFIKESVGSKEMYIDRLLNCLELMVVVYMGDEYGYGEFLLNEESESELEKNVYESDTLSFFSTYFINEVKDWDRIILSDKIYCTDNALFLLYRLLTKGDLKKAYKILDIMEQSIPVLEKNFIVNAYTQTLCEIKKFRFVFLRKRFKIQNNFDHYLMMCVNKHKENIVRLLNDISRKSDFKEIAYNIEMLLEYYWQAGLWEDGEIICNDIIKKLRSVNYYDDDIVHNCLTLEIKIMEICSKFLAHLNRNENVEMKESDVRFSEELSEKSVCMGFTELYKNAINIISIMKDTETRNLENRKDEYELQYLLNRYEFTGLNFDLK